MSSISSTKPYPGSSAVLVSSTVTLDQQQKQIVSRQWEFCSNDNVSLLQCIHLIQMKTHQIAMWMIFYTRRPNIVNSYFAENGIRLELKPIKTPLFYFSRTFLKIEEIRAVYLFIKRHNQFQENCDKIIEETMSHSISKSML